MLLLVTLACGASVSVQPPLVSAQVAPSLRLVTVHRMRVRVGIQGRNWTSGSLVTITIYLAPTRQAGVLRAQGYVYHPTEQGRFEIGLNAVPCGGERAVARDSLGRTATLHF